MFLSPSGTRLDIRNWRRRADWLGARERAELPGLRIHDLRHTAATLWLAESRDVTAVQQLLGHSDASTTLSIYSHVLRHQLDAAADRVAAALAELLPAQRAVGTTGAPEGS